MCGIKFKRNNESQEHVGARRWQPKAAFLRVFRPFFVHRKTSNSPKKLKLPENTQIFKKTQAPWSEKTWENFRGSHFYWRFVKKFLLNLSKNDKNSKIWGKKLRKLREKLKKLNKFRKNTMYRWERTRMIHLKSAQKNPWVLVTFQALTDFWFTKNHIVCSKGQLLPQIYKEEEALKRI